MQVIEDANRLELSTPLRTGMRWGIGLLGLVPLLAPYELLIQAGWQTYAHPFFLLAALISAGAVAVSVLLLFAAVGGWSSRMVFDAGRSTFTFTRKAPILRQRLSEHPISALARVEVATHEWSDGAPSYCLRVVTKSAESFESGASQSRGEVEAVEQRLRAFLRRAEETERAPNGKETRESQL